MGRLTQGRLRERRALNKAMLFVKTAPNSILEPPPVFLRALRATLRMSQAQLAHRSGLAQSHIAAIEAGRGDVQLGTLRRLFDAMFCDLLILPMPRKRPSDAVGERLVDNPDRPWED